MTSAAMLMLTLIASAVPKGLGHWLVLASCMQCGSRAYQGCCLVKFSILLMPVFKRSVF